MTASYVIHNRWALGDTVCISALVRDLALTYPGEFRISHAGHYLSYWENNPYCVPFDTNVNATVLMMDYSQGMEASKAGNKIHFLSWFHKEFERLTSVFVPVLKPKGDIHLSQQEKNKRLVSGRYWVVVAGGKTDITAKWWHYARYQEVVNQLAARGITCVQAGAHFSNHVQPPLTNCVNATGQTDSIRDLFSLIYHAEGVICGITGPMHIAAVFDKPCVVVAGGREEPWWESYTNVYRQFGPQCEPVKTEHRFLHTIGALECCQTRGCWKARTVPIEKADFILPKKKMQLCLDPVRGPQQTVPKCMDMIHVEHVVEAVMSYYERGEIPPIGSKPLIPVPPGMPVPPNAPHLLTTTLVNERTLRDVQKFGELGPVPELLTRPRPVVPSKPPVELPPSFPEEDRTYEIMDHPTLGGKFTVCILSWGDNKALLERCLTAIYGTLPEHRRDIRLALNQPGKETKKYVQANASKFTKVYLDDDDPHGALVRRKYPAMREMFHDEECPITTKYLVWFDDDSYAVDPLWAVRLAEMIVSNHIGGGRLYGRKMFHDLNMYVQPNHDPAQWFRQGSWWKQEQLRVKGVERLAPNGSCLDFVAGWFWAIETAMIYKADIPDVRLNHNGGDITIGAQVHQAGGKVKSFNQDKQFVYTPPKEQGGRRGYSEQFPWSGR